MVKGKQDLLLGPSGAGAGSEEASSLRNGVETQLPCEEQGSHRGQADRDSMSPLTGLLSGFGQVGECLQNGSDESRWNSIMSVNERTYAEYLACRRHSVNKANASKSTTSKVLG